MKNISFIVSVACLVAAASFVTLKPAEAKGSAGGKFATDVNVVNEPTVRIGNPIKVSNRETQFMYRYPLFQGTNDLVQTTPTLTVPEGKQLVIEYVSVLSDIASLRAVTIQANIVNNTMADWAAVGVPDLQNGYRTGGTSMQIRFHPGQQLRFAASRSSTSTTSAVAWVFVSGHYEPTGL